MTSKHDGPRRDAPVTVIQAATPTRLTQAEAEELAELIDAALDTAKKRAQAFFAQHVGPTEYEALDASASEAYRALYTWQLRHGLESK